MADNVEISNVGGQGVASEVTLARLTASIEALARRTGLNPASEAARLQRLHNDAITSGVTVVRDSTEALEENVDAVQDATAATTRMSTSMNGLAGTALGALWRSASELTTMLFQGGSSVSDFTAALPMVGTMLGPLADYVDESIESFRDLSASGASFGNSITNMRNTATGLGLSLGEMTELFTQNAAQLASLGGTVSEGAERFKEMNKNIKATGDFEQLKQMGFTVMEINEGMADYIEIQANMGTLQGRSTKSLAAGSASYLEQVDKLAKITGKTRKQAEADLSAQATDAGIRGLLNALGEGTAEFKNLQLSLGVIGNVGGAAGEAMKDLLDGMPSSASTGQFMAMLGEAGPTMQAALKQIGDGADPQVMLDAMVASGGALEKFAGKDKDARAQYIATLRNSQPVMAEFLDGAQQLIKLGKRDLNNAKAEQDKRNTATKALTTFDDSMRAVGASLQSAFISTGVLDLVSSGLLNVSQMLTALVVPLTSFTNAVTNDGWLTAITDTLKDDLKSLFTGESVIGAVAAGIGVLFASKAIAGALLRSVTGSFSNVFSGIMSSLPGSDTNNARNTSNTSNNSNTRNSRRQRPSRGPAAGAGAGGAIGNFVGSMGAGIMQGAAAGLTAFANPAVLKGAVILAGVIVAVGGAVAGASWMLGKALPTFVSGLKKFEDVNSGALVDAAAGMIAISGAMAVFGVGTAVAGLGALVGELGSGIVALFDGDGPIAKLEKFSAANIDRAKVKSNAEAMVAFSEAMNAAGSAASVGGISAFVDAAGTGLAKFFGADAPLQRLKEFGEFNVYTAGVIRNAEAMVAFAEAMNAAGSAASLGGIGAFVDAAGTGLAKFFGAESTSTPLQRLKEFSEFTINNDGVTKNANAMVAFSTAMSGVTNGTDSNALEAFATGVGNFFGKLFSTGDPLANLKLFGETKINTDQVIANANAMVAFSNAMTNASNTTTTGSFMEGIAKSLSSANTPLANLKLFGETKINTDQVIANSSAMVAFSNAMANVSATTKTAEFDISAVLVTRLRKLGQIDGSNITKTAAGLQSLAGVTGLKTNLAIINSGLDTDKITTYTKAMDKLVNKLEELNKVLAEDNKGLFGGGTGVAAANVVQQSTTAATSGSTHGAEVLNKLMSEMLSVLKDISEDTGKTEKHTKNLGSSNNIARGYVSNMGR